MTVLNSNKTFTRSSTISNAKSTSFYLGGSQNYLVKVDPSFNATPYGAALTDLYTLSLQSLVGDIGDYWIGGSGGSLYIDVKYAGSQYDT